MCDDKSCLSSLAIFSPTGTVFWIFLSWALFMYSEYFTSLFKVQPEAFFDVQGWRKLLPSGMLELVPEHNLTEVMPCIQFISVIIRVQIGSELHSLHFSCKQILNLVRN